MSGELPEPWTIKAYALDRRPPGEGNKLRRRKIDPDMPVPQGDPLEVVRKLARTLEGMDEQERRELVRFELAGPDPQEHLDYYGLTRESPAESTPQESPGGEHEDPEKETGQNDD